MHTPIDAAHSPIVRAAVEGTLHGWQRLSRFQAAIAYPTMKAAATALGLHVTALTVEIQRLESDTSGRLYHRAVHAKPQRHTRHGQTLLADLEEPWHRGRPARCHRAGAAAAGPGRAGHHSR